MIAVALRGLGGRKLRSFLTALAIVLGVSMISGTYVLTDTIDKAFTTLFVNSYAGTDVVISGREAFETDFGTPPPFDEGLLAQVRALPDVDAAAPGITDFAKLTDKDGEAISTGGAPSLAFGVEVTDERFNPLTLTAGDWPKGPDQVVIDKGTADGEGYQVGDTIGVAAKGPIQQFTIAGIAKFGSVDSIGSATFAVFDIPTAQRLFDKVGELDGISVAAKEGVSPQSLAAQIEPLLPQGTKVQTADEQAQDASKDVEDFTTFLRYFLLAFGGIALFVGAFVIFNTLSITVAQRTREFATLRTIGASRRQVLGSVVLEALVIGAVASVLGLFIGLGLAEGLNALFKAFDLDLPQTGLVFAGRTIVVSLVAGIVITLLAGLFPAIRATRVPPIAAVREGSEVPRGRLSKLAPWFAVLTLVLGILLLVSGVFRDGLGTTERLVSLGVGCLVLFLGVAGISSRLVKPLAGVLGRPAEWIGGASGRLARENAMRNPGRTASTAAALMIGLALITFVAVVAQGLRDSIGEAVSSQVNADYVVVNEDNFTPFEPASDEALAAIPGTQVVGVRGDRGLAFGKEENVTGVDPATIASVYVFDWVDGSDATLGELGDDGAVIEQSFAEDRSLAVGDAFELLTPNGVTVPLTVRGIYEAPPFWEMLGNVAIPQATFDASFQDPRNLYTFATVEGGATEAATTTLEGTLADYPGVKLATKAGFIKTQQDSLAPLLNMLYALLALSVIVSLFGIVNTLVLSVFERTRELGMLRAVGMTRRQVRRMIRHESVITALIGGVLGMALGIFLAALVTQALKDEGVVFSVPGTNLVVFAIVAVICGIVAAIFPARRAARLNVLRALQYE
ncbi:MAG: FtsX-like permease family protein [Thermoleophilia bacterium]